MSTTKPKKKKSEKILALRVRWKKSKAKRRKPEFSWKHDLSINELIFPTQDQAAVETVMHALGAGSRDYSVSLVRVKVKDATSKDMRALA